MLTRFHLENFRSCPDWEFSFGEKTYIMGENGSGKTHILDALHFLGGSPFVYTDSHIDVGTVFEALFEENTLPKRYTFHQDDKRGNYAIQGERVTKPKYLKSLPFRTVFVSPFDMNLLYFAPSMRREYIDNLLERSFDQFRKVRSDYETVMRQRNVLLKRVKDGEANAKDLDFWDAKFAELAEIYLLYRKKFVDFVVEYIPEIRKDLPKYTLKFVYESTIEAKRTTENEGIKETVLHYLQTNRDRDILTGHTHIGPHRDDFSFFIETNRGDISAAQFLSRGEMKMLLLAMKKLEVLFLENHIHMPILLLVDDIFAELDEGNIVHFLNSLTPYQTILTSQKPLPEGKNWSDFICINLKDI